MEKVSAATITELTAAAAPVPGAGGTPPTAEELIAQIRASLDQRIKSLAQSMQKAQQNVPKGGTPTSAFKISHKRAVEALGQFEQLVAKVPNGFRLTPVLYSPIDQKQNSSVYKQFGSRVRPEFMRYLAANHAEELTALGISAQGIERMNKGLDPVDQNGHLYDINVDHIIERFGGGTVSTTQEVDPLMPPGSHPTYLANHFGNLILIPTKVHGIKNSLNELQRAASTPHGTSKWVLMLIPIVTPEHDGYVTQPQGHLQTVPSKNTSPLQLAVNTSYAVESILESISQNPVPKEKHEELLKPAFEELTVRLTSAFNKASKPGQGIKPFIKFYQGERFKALRQKIEAMPSAETESLRDTFQWIDGSIKTSFNKAAPKKAANNNTKAPAKKPVAHHKPYKKKHKKHGHQKKY